METQPTCALGCIWQRSCSQFFRESAACMEAGPLLLQMQHQPCQEVNHLQALVAVAIPA